MARSQIRHKIPVDIRNFAKRFWTDAFPFAAFVGKHLPTAEEFRQDLTLRLKKITYPSHSRSTSKGRLKSTYEHLETLGILDVLLPELSSTDMITWAYSGDFESQIREIHSASSPLGKEFRSFHLSMIKELIRHTEEVRRLKNSSRVGEQWIGPYLRSAEEQLMIETSLVDKYLDRKPESEREALWSSVVSVYHCVNEVLNNTNIKNLALARHLTAILCSPNCASTGQLCVDPENMRRSLRRRRGRKPA